MKIPRLLGLALCTTFVWLLVAAVAAQGPAHKPAIYFYDFAADFYNGQVTQELLDAGFEVGKNHGQVTGSRWTLTWDTLKNYNVLVMVGTANDFQPEHGALLDRFLEAGGGILAPAVVSLVRDPQLPTQ